MGALAGGHPPGGNKAILLDYDAITAEHGDSGLFCLTQQQQMILVATLEYLGWKTRWFSDSGTVIAQETIDQIQAGLGEALMVDRCSEIIDKLDALTSTVTEMHTDVDATETAVNTINTNLNGLITDSAEMHTDVDNIETIVGTISTSTTINKFDFRIINNYQDNLTLQVVLASLATPPVGLPQKNWLDKTDNTARSQYAAWCALVNICWDWIYTCGFRWAQITDPTNGLNSTIYNSVVSSGGYFQGTIFDPLVAVLPPTSAQVITAMLDTASVVAVGCDLALALGTRTLGFADWQSAVASLVYTPVTNKAYIAYILNFAATADNVLPANYAGFLTAYSPAYDKAYALNPTSYDACGCSPASPCPPQTWDFTAGKKLPWLFNRGLYAPSAGILATLLPGDGTNYGFDIQLPMPAAGCTGLTNLQVVVLNSAGGGNAFTTEVWTGAGPTLGQSNQSSSGSEQTINIALNSGFTYKKWIRFYCNTPFYKNATSKNCTWAYIKSAVLS